jgi:hypothetical protein
MNFDQDFFRKILRIAATACFVVSIVTVALSFSSAGANCPALIGTPLTIFVTVALIWQAVFWQRTHDQIVSTKTRLDAMGLQNPLMEIINYNILLVVVMVGFVGFSLLPLILYVVQCL